jgi:hypothetical protein
MVGSRTLHVWQLWGCQYRMSLVGSNEWCVVSAAGRRCRMPGHDRSVLPVRVMTGANVGGWLTSIALKHYSRPIPRRMSTGLIEGIPAANMLGSRADLADSYRVGSALRIPSVRRETTWKDASYRVDTAMLTNLALNLDLWPRHRLRREGCRLVALRDRPRVSRCGFVVHWSVAPHGFHVNHPMTHPVSANLSIRTHGHSLRFCSLSCLSFCVCLLSL